MNDLIEDGEISRGYLGMFTGGEVDQTMAKALGLDNVRGVIVGRVEEGGPADNAGLQEQDVIVGLNGEEIRTWASFRTAIASKKPGETIQLEVVRNQERVTLDVELGERSDEQVASLNPGNTQDMEKRLGFSVQTLTDDIKNQLGLSNDSEGVIVSSINEGSRAYERGLRNNDVITSVKRTGVDTASEFYNQIKKATEANDEVVLLTIIRNDLKQYVAFEL